MKIFIIINLFVSLSFANEKELDEAITYIKNIITKKSSNQLKTKSCDIQKEKWLGLFLSKTSFTENIKYNKACDLQGSFKPQMDKYFKVPLIIRDKKFKGITFESKMKLSFEKQMTLNLNVKNGVLTSHKNKKFNFNANQTLILDPLNTKEPIKKSKTGTLNVSYKGTKKTIKI